MILFWILSIIRKLLNLDLDIKYRNEIRFYFEFCKLLENY